MGANMSLERPGLCPESPPQATHLSCSSYVTKHSILIVRTIGLSCQPTTRNTVNVEIGQLRPNKKNENSLYKFERSHGSEIDMTYFAQNDTVWNQSKEWGL
jgi:hypothetical protein